jgi:hypothetical protein
MNGAVEWTNDIMNLARLGGHRTSGGSFPVRCQVVNSVPRWRPVSIVNFEHFIFNEAHQGVMADRRHSLKRGDRLSKKQRQTTASDWKKATNCDLCYGLKVTATFITIN